MGNRIAGDSDLSLQATCWKWTISVMNLGLYKTPMVDKWLNAIKEITCTSLVVYMNGSMGQVG